MRARSSNRVVRAGFLEEVTFALQRMRRYQPVEKANGIAGRGRNKCKGPRLEQACCVPSVMS